MKRGWFMIRCAKEGTVMVSGFHFLWCGCKEVWEGRRFLSVGAVDLAAYTRPILKVNSNLCRLT